MHDHCHHDHHSKPDNWTKLSASSDFIKGYISTSFWLAKLFDLTSGLKGNYLPVSYWGLAFGLFGAIFCAAGATYVHLILNKNHQTPSSESAPLIQHQNSLSWLQKVALGFDFLQHTGEFAGTVAFAFDIATQNRLPRWGQAIIQCSTTIYGGLASAANVRTCSNNMKSENHADSTSALATSVEMTF